MAVSNRDRIQKGFEVLAEGLEPFVDARMSKAAPDGDWIAMLEAREEEKNGARKVYERYDPAVLLRCITSDWRVFSRVLTRSQRSLAEELIGTRNSWAHNSKFSADDTYRALDTMERLLLAAEAKREAEALRQMRLDLQRVAFEAETRKAVGHTEAGSSVAGVGVKPWREVLQPHDDVIAGRYLGAEFAADLATVASGSASEDYADPLKFFERTYLTVGLKDLLDRAIRRVGGDKNASPVINLQTNFGGGKTHSMLAVWHLFGGIDIGATTQDLQELVAGRSLPDQVHRASLVGTHLSPGATSTKSDGSVVHTMWGELAWQLGGRDGYELVEQADQSRTSPGDALKKLFETYAPCVILIDEWVAYARQLVDREDLPAGTFDTQFTFAQTLTEIVKATPGAILVVSIPASDDPNKEGYSSNALEVGGPNGKIALERLQNVVGRIADQWRAADSDESFEIVKRRLFVTPDAGSLSDIAAVSRQFYEFYTKHKGEFPSDCADLEYENRIRRTYPIHPSLFDQLYDYWSTLERFQRTRGVLRLMSAVVHALWNSQDAGPLIMPGSVQLENPEVLREIATYVSDHWKPIIDKDIDGLHSIPVQIDADRPLLGKRATTRRLARALFMGSAPTLGNAVKGIERQSLWLGVAVPGDTVGNFGSALDLLSSRATYMYVDGHRYWFDTHPSIQRTASEYAERLKEQPEEVWLEIVNRLRSTESKDRGSFAGVHVAPDSTGHIPDEDSARLVIIHPSTTHLKGNLESPAMQFARASFEKKGSGQRVNRNMVTFLAADEKRLEDLMGATRTYLGWEAVMGGLDEMEITKHQVKQAKSRRDESDASVASLIGQTYIHALVPEQPKSNEPPVWTVEKCEGQEARLAIRASEKLTRAGLLTEVAAPRGIRMELDGVLATVWESGHISVGQLWSLYCQYPYLTRMKDRNVLTTAIADTMTSIMWESEGFALADGYDANNDAYIGLELPSGDSHFGTITDATLLVHPEVAIKHKPTPTGSGEETDKATSTDSSDPDRKGGAPEASTPTNREFHGVYTVNSELYSKDFTKLSQEILQHLAAADDAKIEITVEVKATSDSGYSDQAARTILENAKALKFDQSTFE